MGLLGLGGIGIVRVQAREWKRRDVSVRAAALFSTKTLLSGDLCI